MCRASLTIVIKLNLGRKGVGGSYGFEQAEILTGGSEISGINQRSINWIGKESKGKVGTQGSDIRGGVWIWGSLII